MCMVPSLLWTIAPFLSLALCLSLPRQRACSLVRSLACELACLLAWWIGRSFAGLLVCILACLLCLLVLLACLRACFRNSKEFQICSCSLTCSYPLTCSYSLTCSCSLACIYSHTHTPWAGPPTTLPATKTQKSNIKQIQLFFRWTCSSLESIKKQSRSTKPRQNNSLGQNLLLESYIRKNVKMASQRQH